jgi:hypothetical protein
MKRIEDLTEFSDQNYARELVTFMGHVDNVSERRWHLILDSLCTGSEEDENNLECSGFFEFPEVIKPLET